MTEAKKGIEALPSQVRERLEELKKNLSAALGDDLVGVLVHGRMLSG